MDKFARSLDPAINQVMASISGVYEEILVAATDGTLAADVRPLVRLSVTVIAEKGIAVSAAARVAVAASVTTISSSWTGSRAGRLAMCAKRCARPWSTWRPSTPRPAPCRWCSVPAGPVCCCTRRWARSGGDFNRKGSSAFAGRIGEQVASKHCTIVDDGTLPGRRGSVSIDDEGRRAVTTC